MYKGKTKESVANAFPWYHIYIPILFKTIDIKVY